MSFAERRVIGLLLSAWVELTTGLKPENIAFSKLQLENSN